mmetsp:Transcript_49245/g.105998  ORF Transcript_49245/g.105998 Transcript_49245/m.105998 type:complete len:152 (+) Transcript_49245:1578-2033(+)
MVEGPHGQPSWSQRGPPSESLALPDSTINTMSSGMADHCAHCLSLIATAATTMTTGFKSHADNSMAFHCRVQQELLSTPRAVADARSAPQPTASKATPTTKETVPHSSLKKSRMGAMTPLRPITSATRVCQKRRSVDRPDTQQQRGMAQVG